MHTEEPPHRRHVALATLLVVAGIFGVLACAPSEEPQPSRSPTTQQPLSTPTSPPATSTEPPVGSACEDDVCVKWSPAKLRCTTDPCTPAVTVWSEGAKPLVVRGLRLTGDAKDRLDTDTEDCLGISLDRGQSCTITVGVAPGRPGRAQLRIQQNLPHKSSVVDIEVAAPGADLDLSVAAPDLRCSVVPDDPYWNADGLTIFVHVVKTGTAKPPGAVPFRVASDTGLNRPGSATLSDDPKALTRMRIPLRRADYDASHVYTLTVDPDDKLRELDETNNSLQVTLPRFDPPVSTSDVPCWTG